MIEDLRQKIERWKILCEDLLEEDKSIFIKYLESDLERWCSANIIFISEKKIYIESFKGHGVGEKIPIRWINIIDIDEYREEFK